MTIIIAFACGVFVGAPLGMLVLALCVAGRER
mgnify:FL=1